MEGWRLIATGRWIQLTHVAPCCQDAARGRVNARTPGASPRSRILSHVVTLVCSAWRSPTTPLQPMRTLTKMQSMLTKRRLEDGGMDVETGLFGPAVFLDVWAVRDLSRAAMTDLRNRFATALAMAGGSLLVSTAWITELDGLQGDARSRAQALFTSLGAHWLLINPVVSAVAAREARNELGAYLSRDSLNGYVLERSGELLRSNTDPHTVSDAEFFDLGRTLVWTAADPGAATTSAAQSQALKNAAKARADADTDEQRQNRTAHLRLYPRVAFASGQMACVHNAVWREVTRRSLGRTWMPNDGFDIAHLIPALTIGGLIAVDRDWKDIGEAASANLPDRHATLYRPGELERLVVDLETRARAIQDEIARRAYEIFEQRGRLHGHDLDDWLQAERELRGRQ